MTTTARKLWAWIAPPVGGLIGAAALLGMARIEQTPAGPSPASQTLPRLAPDWHTPASAPRPPVERELDQAPTLPTGGPWLVEIDEHGRTWATRDRGRFLIGPIPTTEP